VDDKFTRLTEKKKKLESYRAASSEYAQTIWDWFKIELTYASNVLDGNSLTREETSRVIEKELTVEGKSIQDYLETINHAKAVDFIHTLAHTKREAIAERDILDIHRIIFAKIDDIHAGRYRTVSIASDSNGRAPGPMEIPDLMRDFLNWVRSVHSAHPVEFAAEAHFKLMTIYPFFEGTEKTARLFMNLLLMQEGYPPIILRKEDIQRYTDNVQDYDVVICDAVDRSLDIFFEGPSTMKYAKEHGLLKIGALAKATGETIHTLRFWTKEDLLIVRDHTRGGYQLYEESMIQRAKEIRQLQDEKRLTIAEIREQFNSPE